ncbi:hypothetical protein ScPMuIL_003258 [Solemya velum]
MRRTTQSFILAVGLIFSVICWQNHSVLKNVSHNFNNHILGTEAREITQLPDTNTDFIGIRRNTEINCRKIFENDKTAISDARDLAKSYKRKYRMGPKRYQELAGNCASFRSTRGYMDTPVNEEEAMFPIAISVLVFKEIDAFERLLRSIYRPQNVYCVHVDTKSDDSFRAAVLAIVNCFENVLMANKSYPIWYDDPNMLLADVGCMRVLWYTSVDWKYYTNLAGTDFPLRTNLEIVKILKVFNGFNDVEGKLTGDARWRWTDIIDRVPLKLQPLKGSIHVTVNRDFVEYVMTNRTAADLLTWVYKAHYPEETYYSTLNHNPKLGIRGTFSDYSVRKRFLGRYVVWKGDDVCHGVIVHGICVFDLGDLSSLNKKYEMFANKFDIADSFAFDCMEERILNRTKEEISGNTQFNVSYYQDYISALSEYILP